MKPSIAFALGLVAATATPALAQVPPDQMTARDVAVDALLDCRTLTGSADKLRCFEAAADRIARLSPQTAPPASEPAARATPLPKAEAVAESRPRRAEFDRSDATDSDLTRPISPQVLRNLETVKIAEVNSVDKNILKTATFGHGKTRFFLEDGQVWDQVDGRKARLPKTRGGVANTARISAASLGSFLLRINGTGQAIRVKRVR